MTTSTNNTHAATINVERHPAALVSTCHMALRVSLTKVPSSALVLCFLCFFSVSFLRQLAMHFKSVKHRKHISKQANLESAMQEQNYLKPWLAGNMVLRRRFNESRRSCFNTCFFSIRSYSQVAPSATQEDTEQVLSVYTDEEEEEQQQDHHYY